MNQNDTYDKIAEKFGYKDWQSAIEYLEMLFTPEEGELLLEMLAPTTCQELAIRLKTDEKSLFAKLDNLTRRGLLFRGKTQYVFQIGMHVGFAQIANSAEEYVPADYYIKWKPFHEQVLERDLPGKLQSAEARKVPGARIIPARLAIAASPKIRPEQVLWYEDMAQILAREPVVGVVDCPCRKEFHNCDRPLGGCMHFSVEWMEYELNRHSAMKKLNLEEAIAASDLMETGGLLHLSGNSAGMPPQIMCHCCECCCVVFGPPRRAGKVKSFYAPTRFLAVVEQELCNGCQTCVERCFFDAIEMRKAPNSKKLKANIVADNCMGCGLCVVGCKQKALTFELVRPPEHIPSEQESGSRLQSPEQLANPAIPSGVGAVVRWLK